MNFIEGAGWGIFSNFKSPSIVDCGRKRRLKILGRIFFVQMMSRQYFEGLGWKLLPNPLKEKLNRDDMPDRAITDEGDDVFITKRTTLNEVEKLKVLSPILGDRISKLHSVHGSYVVTYRVKGETLTQANLSPSQKILVADQLIDIFERLYNLGYYHGDIQSENIIVGPDSRVTVIDFNTCSRMSEFSSDIGYGFLLPPESAMSDGDSLSDNPDFRYDFKADLYALGSTLYTILTDNYNPSVTTFCLGYDDLSLKEFTPVSYLSQRHNLILRGLLKLNPDMRYFDAQN